MRLAEVCEINPKNKDIDDNTEVSFIAMPDVFEDGRINTGVIRPYYEVKKGFTCFREGDVLFAKISPCMENGKGALAVGLKNRIGCGSTEFHVLRPDPKKIQGKWLYYLTAWPAFRKDAERHMTGSAGQKRVPKSFLEKYEFLVPTINEQINQINALDHVKAIIELRKQELQNLDNLIKARFVEMFGDPLNGTEKWPLHIVGDVAESVDPQPSHRTPPIDKDGIPYVSIKDCDYKTGIIDFDNARKVGRHVLEEHRNRYTLHDGDFIIGKIGTIGNPIFVPVRDDYTLSANIVLVQPDHSKVSPYFLKYSFMSAYMDRQFEEAKNSTSQAAFGIQKVRQIRVMNPDLSEQYAFETFAKQVDKSKVVVQKALDEAQLLFDSLMQQYFG